MAASSSTLKWVLVGEDRTGKAFKSAASGLDTLAEKSKSAGKTLTLGLSAPIAAAGALAVRSASDQQQAFGALDSVFKGNAAAMKAWSLEQQAIGLSASEAANSATYMGSMLKNAGLDAAQAAAKSQSLVSLGADLAATFGGPTSDAVAALGAALRGEMDPIERYGVSIKQSDINARMAKDGLTGLKGEQKKAAEQATRLALIMEQTADAQGQAARESDTFAGTTGRLKASLANTAAVVGTAVLPAVTDMADVLGKTVGRFAEWFQGLDDGSQRMVLGFTAAAAAIGPLLWGFGKAIEVGKSVVSGAQALHRVWQVGSAIARVYALSAAGVIKSLAASTAANVKAAAKWVVHTGAMLAHKTASIAVAAASKAMAAAQWLVNVALTANPIGLVVAALAALGAGLVLAWKKSDKFREIVTGAFRTIGVGVLKLGKLWLTWMKWQTDAFLALVEAVVTGAAKAFGWVPGVGDKLKNAAKAVEGFRDRTAASFDRVIGKVGDATTKLEGLGREARADKTAKLRVEAADAMAKIAAAKRELKDPNLTKERRAKLKADIADLQRKVSAARRAIDNVKGKTVTLDVKVTLRTLRELEQSGRTGGGAGGNGGSAGLMGLTQGIGRRGAKFGAWGPRWSWNRNLRTGMGQHDGADISAPYGTRVWAPAGFRFAGRKTGSWHGNAVVMTRGNDRLTLAHLSRFGGTSGVVGYVGATGNASGAHLHAQLTRSGRYIDPAVYLEHGGIVRRRPGGTLAVIGEGRHDEAVVPLPRGGSGLGGELHVHFHGPIIGSREDLARYVTDAQREYRRKRGGVGLGLG